MRGSAFMRPRVAPVQAALHGSASLRAYRLTNTGICPHLPLIAHDPHST
ncbi:hypothetical protein C7S14_2913 [Burkholderia cepacia]|nr:hypothetical protein C7S14_2913 [Burkholderia cepacia]